MTDGAQRAAGGANAGLALPALMLAGLVALGLRALSLPPEINGDTSWLLTVVERLAHGEKAYVDVMETNPPMAFLIYWPTLWLRTLTGFNAEWLVYAQTGFLSLLSLALCWRLSRGLGLEGARLWLAMACIAYVFLLLPSRSFTQREHLALLLLLPAVLMLAGRAAGRPAGLAMAVGCGLMAGLGASIKPHFVLVVALPALAAALHRRDWRVLFAPEAIAAALFFLAYVALWIARYPEFFDMPMFLTANTYRLYTYRPLDYFRDFSSIVFVLAVAVGVVTTLLLRRHSVLVTIAMAALGFALAFVEQGKGFAYHLYPVAGMVLILLGFALALAVDELPRLRSAALFAGAAMAAANSCSYSQDYPDSAGLKQAIVAIKPKPSLMILTFDIAVNFPLARQLDAAWASRLQSTWISNSAFHAFGRNLSPEQRMRTERAVAIERDWLAEDIRKNRPDVIVIDRPAMLEHFRQGEAFREAFDGAYLGAGTAQEGRFLLFRRKDG